MARLRGFLRSIKENCQGEYVGILTTVNLLVEREKSEKLSNKNALPEL